MPKGYTEDFKHLLENKLTWFSETIYQQLQRVFLGLPRCLLKRTFNTCVNSDMGLPVLPSLGGVSARRLVIWAAWFPRCWAGLGPPSLLHPLPSGLNPVGLWLTCSHLFSPTLASQR